MYSDYCKISSKCASLENISNRGMSLQRNLNGNMDSTKYQSDIIHDIEMSCDRFVFLQMGYICMHDLAPCHDSKSTIIYLDC